MTGGKDGTSCYSNVFGEHPIIPNVLPSIFDMKELSMQLHKLYHHYTPTRQRQQKTFLPDQIQKCDFVCVRLDRVKKPLEAPYRGPYSVIERKNDVFVLEVREKPNSVSIED